jgi:hypothetical protein
MDDIRKPTHLNQEAMRATLEGIGCAGMRDAMKAWTEGRRPENFHKFRRPRGWVVLDSDGRRYAHRPLIALACELSGQQALDPNNFGLPNDEVCKEWLDQEKIARAPV